MTAVSSSAPADALVFFEATRDPACKQIFPALYATVGNAHSDMPVIGVARPGWGVQHLRERMRTSTFGYTDLNEPMFARIAARLRYVDVNYRDPSTFTAVCRELDGTERPLHSSAIPSMQARRSGQLTDHDQLTRRTSLDGRR